MAKLTNQDILDMIIGRLITKAPFYGRIGMYLEWGIREDLPFPTAATDGRRIWYHPDFLQKHANNISLLMYVAIHEMEHVIRQHNLLRKFRDPQLWNVACDYKINYILDLASSAYNLTKPDDILRNEKYNSESWLEEDVYDDLLNSSDKQWEKEPQNSTGGYEWGEDPDEGETQEERRRIERMVDAAYKVAKDAGKLPGYLEDFCNKLKEKQIDWRSKLRRHLAPVFPRHVSWEKLNRRAISRQIYCPAMIKDGIGNLAVLIDTSGSVSEAECVAMLSEVNYLVSTLRPVHTQVIYFESYPWRVEDYNGNEFMLPTQIQSGGTNFQKAFEAITNNPKAIICLTDMCDSFAFDPRPNTIWVATTDQVAPWGETVRIKV